MVSWRVLKALCFFSTYIKMACVLNKELFTVALVANENAICIAWSQWTMVVFLVLLVDQNGFWFSPFT
jgi:hypothetical protein